MIDARDERRNRKLTVKISFVGTYSGHLKTSRQAGNDAVIMGYVAVGCRYISTSISAMRCGGGNGIW